MEKIEHIINRMALNFNVISEEEHREHFKQEFLDELFNFSAELSIEDMEEVFDRFILEIKTEVEND